LLGGLLALTLALSLTLVLALSQLPLLLGRQVLVDDVYLVLVRDLVEEVRVNGVVREEAEA